MKRESSGRWVFWKKLRMLALGFAGFFDKVVAVADFLGVRDRFGLAVETMVVNVLYETSILCGGNAMHRCAAVDFQSYNWTWTALRIDMDKMGKSHDSVSPCGYLPHQQFTVLLRTRQVAVLAQGWSLGESRGHMSTIRHYIIVVNPGNPPKGTEVGTSFRKPPIWVGGSKSRPSSDAHVMHGQAGALVERWGAQNMLQLFCPESVGACLLRQ
jgi:hypothetical protein